MGPSSWSWWSWTSSWSPSRAGGPRDSSSRGRILRPSLGPLPSSQPATFRPVASGPRRRTVSRVFVQRKQTAKWPAREECSQGTCLQSPLGPPNDLLALERLSRPGFDTCNLSVACHNSGLAYRPLANRWWWRWRSWRRAGSPRGILTSGRKLKSSSQFGRPTIASQFPARTSRSTSTRPRHSHLLSLGPPSSLANRLG